MSRPKGQVHIRREIQVTVIVAFMDHVVLNLKQLEKDIRLEVFPNAICLTMAWISTSSSEIDLKFRGSRKGR